MTEEEIANIPEMPDDCRVCHEPFNLVERKPHLYFAAVSWYVNTAHDYEHISIYLAVCLQRVDRLQNSMPRENLLDGQWIGPPSWSQG